ncbi:DMSO/TMAO reductase YedYZ molybdopterin-dependent catalytic subunit [Variovorax boronicumulans]|uniref:molybdopterin-dependent oxidoreductase n=1 Tax=Variovorax boronicumulans TaxID=436515 RepID=UPI0027841F65|nr:molybdopterin-dependent oxidoreductase [Variovorax boronicumulans]MDP9908058.1 DMSO/TMAO reductase YedYZ molybdopterin-dependent catalytic subunit [Variovorax boronicumulans]
MNLFFKRPPLVGVDGDAVVREARALIERQLDAPSRRLFLRRSLTLGGLSMLTGCSISDDSHVEAALAKVSRFNDEVQGWLFSPTRLAPTYTEAEITRPFPFNAYYGEDEVREVDEATYRLEVSGMVADKRRWTLAELRALPQEDQITRHICVEGWSAIGKWGGVRFADFLRHVGADLSAKYVGFQCADDYHTSIDMPTALHPQTLLALSYDGQPLPPKYGFPMKLRMPTKLGYKNPKHIQAMYVTNTYPGGYWEDQGYNWFGGS